MNLRPSYSSVTATVALFVALGGTGYAAGVIGPNSVGPRELKKNSVSTKKVKDRSLLARDFRAGQLPRGARGPGGAAGPAGRTGATGARGGTGLTGPQGAVGPSSAREAVFAGGPVAINVTNTTIATLPNLAPGDYTLEAVAGLTGAQGTSGQPLAIACAIHAAGLEVAYVESTFTPDPTDPAEPTHLTVPLQTTATFAESTDVALSCLRFFGGTGAFARISWGSSLIATKVGDVSP